MIGSDTKGNEIEELRNTEKLNGNQLRRVIDELQFSAYYRLIKHNSDLLSEKFDDFNYQDEFTEIKNFRNTDKHDKSEILPYLSGK